MSFPPVVPYELRVGVTGHRELPDAAAVERTVTRLFDVLKALIETAIAEPRGPAAAHRGRLDRFVLQPASTLLAQLWRDIPRVDVRTPEDRRTPVQWTVISPLALGADRIVAKVALDHLEARLEVPMPFAEAEYRKDFAEGDDIQEFETLLARASERFPPQDKPALGAERPDAYREVGHRVVNGCELLLAIWDGQATRGRGGTRETIEYALQQGRLVLWIDATAPDRPVQVLRLPSQIPGSASAAADANRPAPLRRLVGALDGLSPEPDPNHPEPVPGTLAALSAGLLEHAAYFRIPAPRLEPRKQATAEGAKLEELGARAQLPADAMLAWLEQFRDQQEHASRLAVNFQELYDRAARSLYTLSSLAVSFATVQIVWLPECTSLVGLEVLSIACIPLLLGVSSRQGWHRKWLNDRHLAERLRVAMFVALARQQKTASASGSAEPPPRPPQGRLPFYEGPSGWMAAIAERLARDYANVRPTTLGFERVRDFVLEAWLLDQANWHAENAHSKHEEAHADHLPGYVLFGTTFVLALLHFFHVGHGSWVATVISILAIVLPAWGAGLHAFASLRDYERIAARSARMARILGALAARAAATRSWEELEGVVLEAAALMESENQEWAISLRYRELALPG